MQNRISILAYSPLAQGLLTGKFGRDHKFPQGDNRAGNKLFQGETYETRPGRAGPPAAARGQVRRSRSAS